MSYSVFSYYFYYILIAGLLAFVDSFDETKTNNSNNNINNNNNNNLDKWETNNKSKIDDIRCFCNLPQCVLTGYMCRTARSSTNMSGCFSEIREPSEILTRHGCVELLKNIDQRVQCDNSPRHYSNNINNNNIKVPSINLNTEMLLLCCHEDMCNHVDSPENQKMKSDRTDNPDILNAGKFQKINTELDILHFNNNHNFNVPMLPSPGLSSNEDWFRVATIAVPICGAVILFSLIAVAIKILRSERITASSSKLNSSKNDFNRKIPQQLSFDHEAQNVHLSTNFSRSTTNNQHNQQHHQHEQHHNHQYASDNVICDKKNETRAKINQLINLEYSLLPQSSNSIIGCGGFGETIGNNNFGIVEPLIKPNNLEPSASTNLYKNVNINLDPTNKIYEKEVLSPITADWNCTNTTLKSYEI